MKPKIFVGVPCLDHVRTQTANTLVSLVRSLSYIEKIVFQQRCYIHLSREKLAKMALDGGYSHILFIDSDMCFSPLVIERLLSRDKDIIAGLYYHRRLPLEPVVGMINEEGLPMTLKEIPKDIFKCYAAGTGCMLIKTEVFKRMPKPWFFYEPPNEIDDGIGEDTWFCKKANEMGIEVWVDPTVQVGHIGEIIFQQ